MKGLTVENIVECWVPCLCNDHYTVYIVFDRDKTDRPNITMHKEEWRNCPDDIKNLEIEMFEAYHYDLEPTIKIQVM